MAARSTARRGTCANCGHPVAQAFCPSCGQRTDTQRIDGHYLWHELQHGLFHVDRGILFTLRELFTRPGHSIREFLDGKRVRHFKPLAFVVITAGVYSFLSTWFTPSMLAGLPGGGRIPPQALAMLDFFNKHYALLELASLPLISGASWVYFRKAGRTYAEHLVANSFLAGQRYVVSVLQFPLLALFGIKGALLAAPFLMLSYAGLYTWGFMQLFQGKAGRFIFLRAVMAAGTGYMLVVIVGMAIAILWVTRASGGMP
ncbi:MAG TPA: DUF3667 domain-containing protein [Flavobacteriales bacterium]|nr:DUF3667 domain-containing protein [Flavobacteriales bacterium]HMR28311.1 DUF3667 domain-containing protein [Flavobacteriales bacterium]